MLVEGIVALLAADPGVRSALNLPRSDGSNGIYPSVAPDEALMPYVVYTQVHREVVLSYQGVNKLAELRFQFSCYGPTYKTAKLSLAAALKNALDGFTGVLPDADQSFVGQTIPNSEHDETESAFKATVYGIILDYTFIATNG